MEKYTGLEIAVIGLAGKFPKADNIHEYWENLKNGRSCISDFTEEEILEEDETEHLVNDPSYIKSNAYIEGKKYFDSEFFGYRPDEAELMDPQIRIYHECCWEALEDSGYSNSDSKEKIGFFATGSTNINWETYSIFKNREGLVDPFTAAHLRNITFLSSKISYKLNFKGPSVFLQTACSSSLVAVHEACNSLLLGECSMALAGGVTINNFSKKGYLYKEGMIHSKDGKCRPFDAKSNGTVIGEGAGVVVLKRLKDAILDGDNIYAVIKGTGINNDGNNKVGYTAPSIKGQAEVVLRAMKMARVSPDSIGYIEAHGTATELGDPIEIEALNEAYVSLGSNQFNACPIGSVKSNIGHLDSAAGIAGFIKTVLAIKNKQIPASLYFNSPNAKIAFNKGPFYVNNTLQNWESITGPLRAGVSSFGIGGTNAHVVLEEAPADIPLSENRAYKLIVLSGKTKQSLELNTTRFIEHLKKSKTINLSDAAYTLQRGRERFQYRKFLVCENSSEAIDSLSFSGSVQWHQNLSEDFKNIVFMFPGQGAQYRDMCRDLYVGEKIFKDKIDECLKIARLYSDRNLFSALFSQSGSQKQEDIDINDTQYSQPLLFMVEYGLAHLLFSWGIKPNYMIGHSIGEYVAACISGVFSLTDAVKLVIRRGELMAEAEKGSMLSVAIKEEKLKQLLCNNKKIDLAAINSENSLVVSGKTIDVDEFEENLAALGYQSKKLHTSHAFHSYLMNGASDKFEKEFAFVKINPPQIPYISNITGEVVKYDEIKNASYWSGHLRNTVNFSKGIEELLRESNTTFLEIGPGRTLCNYINESRLKNEGHSAINTVRQFRQEVNDQKYLIEKLGSLWLNGIDIDWGGYYMGEKRKKVSLPTYSFEKTPYTADVNAYRLLAGQLDGRLPESSANKECTINLSSWQRSTSPNNALELREEEFTFLVFSGNEEFSGLLNKMLMSAGQRVIEVRLGHSFSKLDEDIFEVDLSEPDDLAALWQHLEESNICANFVIYCAALSDDIGKVKYEDIDGKLVKGYLGLSYLAKSLARRKRSEEIKIVVVNNHLANITEEDEVDPLKAAIHGPARIIPSEIFNVKSQVIDIPYPFFNEKQENDYLTKVINELLYDSEDAFVAYRYNERWIETFLSEENEKVNSNIEIVNNGTYIITGGFGGMGFTIADDLVHQFKSNVVIVYRSDFPEKKDWDNWLLNNRTDDPVSRRIQQILEMERTGCIVDLFQVDLSVEEQVEDFIREVRKKYQKINGLIWAAGEVDFGGIILNRKKDDFIKYTSSKVHGLLLFEKYLEFEALDFIALFSSIGNVFYQSKFGQVSYNAANEFLEYYPFYARKKINTRVFTINWCDWLDVGMTVKTRMKEIKTEDIDLVNSGISDAIFPKEGVRIFHRCLKSKAPLFTIYKGDIQAAIKAHKQGFDEIKKAISHPTGLLDYTKGAKVNLEEKLIEVFSLFFAKDNIGLGDNFFELGGDSLRGMTLIARINQQIGVNLSIGDIYKYPTIKQILKEILDRTDNTQISSTIPKAPLKKYYSLSSAQKRMYFLQLFDKESTVYNESLLFWLMGDLDKNKLENVFDKLIQRHESLRTSFVFENGKPHQLILNEFTFKIEHFRYDATNIKETLLSFIRPFDLSNGPLIRVGIVEKGPRENLIIVDSHHIITDGISKDILIKDFTSLYKDVELEERQLQYKDYAEWQQSEEQEKEMARHKEFWLKEFSEETTMPELPIDFERPIIKSHVGGTVYFDLSVEETGRLKEIAETEGSSLFMVLLSVYYVFLSKLTNEEDLVVGTPTAGRQHADLENMVGMFVNMLALRNYPKGELQFKEFLSAVRLNTLSCFDNQSFQYEELIETLKIERDLSRNPLFDTVFSYENFELSNLTIPGITLEAYESDAKISKFDLRLTSIERDNKLYCNFEYSTSLFKEETIDRFVLYFKQIVSRIVSDVSIRLSDIELISEIERKKILNEFNNTSTVYSTEKTIVDLFEEQVEKSLGKTAIVSGGQCFSYVKLNSESNRIARFLREKGIQRESSVVVVMERHADLIMTLFGILKSGGKYIPVEPYLPANRIKTILESVNAECIITNKAYTSLINDLAKEVLSVKNILTIDIQEKQEPDVSEVRNGEIKEIDLSDYSPLNLDRWNKSDDLAYVIFTSGSSGEPKGVAVQHKPVINLIEWVNKTYNVGTHDKLLFVSSISFDLSVYDIFGGLAAGACIRVVNRQELEDPEMLAEIIIEEGITFWDSAPAMLQQIVPFLQKRREQAIAKGKLRLSFLSGDWIPLTIPNQLKSLFHKLRFIALGGATEATIWSNFYEVERVDPSWNSIPYGKPIQNAKYLILDKDKNLCPIGVPGDLYIGGECLAIAYINDKELSDKKFIPSKFYVNEMLYNTGDTARWFLDGNIEFLGRKDSQVKIRGYRIELGEIERRLSEYDGISYVLAQVIAKNKYDKFICVYYVSKFPLEGEALRDFLHKDLPSYMLPKYFIHIERIPVTKNGKVDRKLLPLPELVADLNRLKKPQTIIETQLVLIWAELLSLDKEKIGVNDEFFALGGHSIMAVHLIHSIQQKFSISVKLRDIFQHVTIEKLAGLIERSVVKNFVLIPKAERKAQYPVSPAQKRLFYEQISNVGNTGYNLSGSYEIKGEVDINRLLESFELLINRHVSLRTTFEITDNHEVIQMIKEQVDFELIILDLNDYSSIEDAYNQFVREFDLSQCPLMRCALLIDNKYGNILFVDIHHIICDGVSLNILMNDFKDIYFGNSLKPIKLDYIDYASWYNSQNTNVMEQEKFWLEKLSGELPGLEMPVIQSRELVDVFKASRKILEIEAELSRDIKQLTNASNISDFMFFLSIYYILLSKISGNNDVIIGTDVIGRTHPECHGMVGTFVNLLPLRVNLPNDQSYEVFLQNVKECVLGAYDHQDYQVDQIISLLNKEGRLTGKLFYVHFAFVNYFDTQVNLNDGKIVPFELKRTETSQFEFKLEVIEDNYKVNVHFIYNEALYDEHTIDLLMRYYHNILVAVLDNSMVLIKDVELDKRSERILSV